MALNQFKTFDVPVHQANGGGTAGVAALVIVGSVVQMIQRDRGLVAVTLTGVSDGAKRLEWAITAGQPRSEDIIGVDGRHQYNDPSDDPLHTDPSQFDQLPPVQQTS